MNPIAIDNDGLLIDGMHRYHAAQIVEDERYYENGKFSPERFAANSQPERSDESNSN